MMIVFVGIHELDEPHKSLALSKSSKGTYERKAYRHHDKQHYEVKECGYKECGVHLAH
jgi:hypothetical protein